MNCCLDYQLNDSLSVVNPESGECVLQIRNALCGDPADLGAALQSYMTLQVLRRLGVIEEEGEE